MKIEEQHKSRITENRLIPISFYERLKAIGDKNEFNINNENYQIAWDILSKFIIDDIELYTHQKERCRQYFNKHQILTLYNEFYNCYLTICSSLRLSSLFLEEIKLHFTDNFKQSKPTPDTYLTELIFLTKLHLEITLILQVSFFYKISQFLNVYMNAKLKEKDVDYHKLKNAIELKYVSYEKIGLNVHYLRKLMSIKDIKKDGIAVFDEINKVRRNIIHRVGSVINKFYSNSTLKEFELQQNNAKNLLEICAMTIDDINSLIIDNKYNVSKLY